MTPALRTRTVARVVMHAVVYGAVLVATSAHQPQGAPATAKPPTILFMCPHGAAKSVLASAYFQRLAKERGLNVRVISAGTDPEPQVAPAVANHLTKNGYEIPISKPRRVTDADLSSADVVISIGCDLKGLPTPKGTLMNWDDVPPLSEDFQRADERIRARVIQLVDDLVRKQQR